MTQVERAVVDAALQWADHVRETLAFADVYDQLGPEDLALYNAVDAYRAARGDA